GEVAHERVGRQFQAVHDAIDAMLEGPAVIGFDILLQSGHGVEYRRIAPVRVLGVSHGVIATQQVAQFSESSRYVVVDGLITELGEGLIERGYTQLRSEERRVGKGRGRRGEREPGR